MLRKLGFGLTALVIMSPGVAAALGVGEYELSNTLVDRRTAKTGILDNFCEPHETHEFLLVIRSCDSAAT